MPAMIEVVRGYVTRLEGACVKFWKKPMLQRKNIVQKAFHSFRNDTGAGWMLILDSFAHPSVVAFVKDNVEAWELTPAEAESLPAAKAQLGLGLAAARLRDSTRKPAMARGDFEGD